MPAAAAHVRGAQVLQKIYKSYIKFLDDNGMARNNSRTKETQISGATV
jgi:hypothetical protein